MLLKLKQFHSATVFHQNILDQVTFCQRVELMDQDSKGQISPGKITTLFGTEALNHKTDRLAEKANNSEDIRLQELEECQGFSARKTQRLGQCVVAKPSSASGGRGRTSSNGPSSSHPTSTQ